jgi:hypothetical protein
MEQGMICTKCGQEIDQKSGYFRTKKGAHHYKCGLSNAKDKVILSGDLIEKMIALYDQRGPQTTKFEAMSQVAELALTQK